MPGRYRQAVLAATLSLVLLPGPAQACAYDGLAFDLMLAHPASLDVSLAVARAYQDRLIAQPVPLPGGFGMRRALSMLETLRGDLPVEAGVFHLLLVEPGLWARVEPGGITLHVAVPSAETPQALMGEGVLLALQKGQLSGEQALQAGLLRVEGPEALRQAWLTAYPQPHPPARTEHLTFAPASRHQRAAHSMAVQIDLHSGATVGRNLADDTLERLQAQQLDQHRIRHRDKAPLDAP